MHIQEDPKQKLKTITFDEKDIKTIIKQKIIKQYPELLNQEFMITQSGTGLIAFIHIDNNS